MNLDGRTTSCQTEQRLLEIRPGSSSNIPIIFKGQGHDSVTRESSDLIFKITEVWHERFIRKGNNLFYVVDISLIDALNSQSIEVTTLDNRILRISIDEIIT